MATYEDVGQLNSSNLNHNNNNNSQNNRDTTYDYPIKTKSSTMPKHFYQNLIKTNKRDLNASQTSSQISEHDLSTNSTDSSKRIHTSNGKFSIQKMLRQGFSSWRTRKKPPPPPPTLSTNISTPTIAAQNLTTDNLPSDIHPSTTTLRSVSVDALANQISTQPIIVTEQILPAQVRANSVDSVTVDFDRPHTTSNNKGYIQSPWANSPSVTTSVPITKIIPIQTSESSLPRIPPPGRDILVFLNFKSAISFS